ncbi:unnamed protein product [Staurois parvus]|uniref:Uncharacterized protein n=1 Tax=Staurois parvus TaxID=386267 RepID=A0ABN9GML0_9NEOB|nr:unnamed protein product [Staurois parvus]
MCRYGWIRAGWMDGRVVSVVRRAKSATCGQQGTKRSRQRMVKVTSQVQ